MAANKDNIKVLIVSTADAIKNMWNAEIVPQKILPEGTVLMSLNAAIVEKTKANLLKIKWDVIIIDECHKIKSHNTKSSKLVYQLSKRAEYVWGLSGTPRGNSDVDIYCQFHNMCISDWGNISYTQFLNICDIEQKFFGGNTIRIPTGINKKYKDGWERNISMYTQRVDYTEEDEMPELNVNVVKLPYTPSKEYLQVEQGVLKVGNFETTMAKLAVTMKLHQAVNGYLYVPNEDDDSKKDICRLHRNPKLDWLLDNVETEPTVIVYRFEADYEDILEEMSNAGFICTDNVECFKEGRADILLLQCSRCESFNLQMCKRIIFYTLDYSYIKYNQMLHRVWRMGQNDDVEIVILIFDDTVESNIWKAVKNKETFAQLFMSIKGG